MNIVFIHGLAGSKRYFAAFEKNVSKIVGAKTLSFDLLGFGEQRHARSNFTAEEHIQFIDQKITHTFGAEPIVVVGHSLGGVLTLLWTARHWNRVRGIILLNTPLGETGEEVEVGISDLRQSTLSWGYLILKHRFLARVSCNILCRFNLMRLFRFAKPSFVPNEVFEDYHRHTWNSLTKTFENIVLAHPAKPLLASLNKTPVLILAGSHDSKLMRVNPATPHITYIELPGGHFTILEHQAESLRYIVTFLKSL